MKKLLLILLCVPLMFSCGENKKINELEKEIKDLNDKIDKLDNLDLEDLEEEEIEIIENKNIITSEEGKLEEVTDNINENNEIFSVKETSTVEETPPEIKLTEQEKAFDKNNDGKIDIVEQKKLNEFLEKIFRIGNLSLEEYNGVREKGEGEGNGKVEGIGFGDGLDLVVSHNSIDPATLDCKQVKGTGGLTIQIIRSPYGKIVEFDQTSFKSTLLDFTFSSDQQKERLLDCIKKEYNEAIDNGKKVKIYEKDHLHTLKLDFTN